MFLREPAMTQNMMDGGMMWGMGLGGLDCPRGDGIGNRGSGEIRVLPLNVAKSQTWRKRELTLGTVNSIKLVRYALSLLENAEYS